MINASKINLEPIILFLNELWHALVRPAVSLQIIFIVISLLAGLLIVQKTTTPIKIFGSNVNNRAKSACLALVLILIVFLVATGLNQPSGLIKEAGSLVLAFIILSACLQIAGQLANQSCKRMIGGYRDRLILPAFTGYCLYKVIQIFGDPGALFGTPVIHLFQTPFGLGDALLLTIGLAWWINLSSLITQTLEWILRLSQSQNQEVTRAIYILIRYGLIGLGLFIIIGMIGIDPTVFGLITGGLSVGVGLGLKEIISNFVSGIWLLLEGSTRPGDVINLNLLDSSTEPFQVAKITDCGLRAVTVTNDTDHSERIIPNNLFFTNQITTYTKNHHIIARKSYFGVDYGSDPLEVIDLITETVKSHPEVLCDPAPSTRFIAYGDSSLNFYVKFFIADVMGGIRVTSEINLLIWETLKKHSIEIPFPQRTLHFSDPLNVLKTDESNG